MTVHLQRQIHRLKQQIIALGERTEQSLRRAIDAVEQRDALRAQQIVDDDSRIDAMELEVEEECLHTLALHQPVAFDLRYVVAVLKINNDLERIADMAVNIAEQAIVLSHEPPIDPPPFDVRGMADKVLRMLNQALDAMLEVDAEQAARVRAADDDIDAIHRRMYEQVEAAMRRDPDHIGTLIRYMGISRQLERIADLTTNIAEDVIYMARGDILRHKSENLRPDLAP